MTEITVRRVRGGYRVAVTRTGRTEERVLTDLTDVLRLVAKECGHVGNVHLEPLWMMMCRPAVVQCARLTRQARSMWDMLDKSWRRD